MTAPTNKYSWSKWNIDYWGASWSETFVSCVNTFRADISSMMHGKRAFSVCCAPPDRAPLAAIVDYRNRHYLGRRQPYLTAVAASGKLAGDEIDMRSQHFWARHDDAIVGVVRGTAAPFEWEALVSGRLPKSAELTAHIELGRLVAPPFRGGMEVSLCLLAAACAFGIDAGFDGLIAICRSAQMRLFGRLGCVP